MCSNFWFNQHIVRKYTHTNLVWKQTEISGDKWDQFVALYLDVNVKVKYSATSLLPQLILDIHSSSIIDV